MESEEESSASLGTELSFNSLQTGRSMESGIKEVGSRGSNRVSIPFKREGAWKGASLSRVSYPSDISFNSLQTGRSMERNAVKSIVVFGAVKFQFPSNGKEHGKCFGMKPCDSVWKSFNSLQTGRSMESILGDYNG